MIIETSPQLANLSADGWAGHLAAIRSILFAHQQGWHIFAPKRSVLQSLLAADVLDQHEANFLQDVIGTRIPTLLGQARSAKRSILCICDQNDLTIPEARHCPVPISRFANARSVQPARLLVEDRYADGAFLMEVFGAVANDIGIHWPLELDIVHGGGGGVERQYREALDEIRPMLCILDSDRSHKDDRLGETARSVARNPDSNTHGTVRYVILHAREIENLVPLSFYFEVFANDRAVRERISQYYRFIDENEEDVVRLVMPFVDLKLGVERERWEAYPEDTKGAFDQLASCCSPAQGPDKIPNISQSAIQMTLRLLRLQPRYRGRFSQKMRKSPDFEDVRPICELIGAFGASLGRLPTRV